MFVFSAFSYLFLLPTRSSSFLTFPTPFSPSLLWREEICFSAKAAAAICGWSSSLYGEGGGGGEEGFLFFAALHHFLSHHFCCCWRVNLNWAVCSLSFILIIYLIPSMMDLSTVVIIVAFSLVSAGEFIRVGLYKMFFKKRNRMIRTISFSFVLDWNVF